MSLSRRLSELKKFHSGQPIVWDIGCDHGLLGLSFSTVPSVKEIHLVDPSSPVIEKLKQTIKDSDIPRSFLLFIEHKKGQDITLSHEPNCIFIAGMGGKEIRDILLAIESTLKSQDLIVISPHRNILLLREALNQSSLRLEHESVSEEDGQFYPMLVLRKDNNFPQVSLYGTNLWQTDTGKSYGLQQIKAFESHQDPRSQAYLTYLKQNID